MVKLCIIMVPGQAHITHKKTDEPIDFDENDENPPIKFTLLDILRMLAGLILLYGICSRILSGKWINFGFSKSASLSPYNPPSIPEYWSLQGGKYNSIPFSVKELSQYSAESGSERILLSVKGHVFDVTEGSRYYGKWGAYKKFTGNDCSRQFTRPQWDVSVLGKECSSDLSDSTPTEIARVDSWLQFFRKKYPEIGYVEGLLSN